MEIILYSYYMPTKVVKGANLPVYVWVHGGSGVIGSSTGAGLDGTPFVQSQNVIVVLLQYRLGLFGWLQTGATLNEATGGQANGTTVAGNQAMRDVVMALQQVKAVVPIIGGDASKVVLMGQSSGASMVRALLTTPAADNLFSHAVIVSDTADYGLSEIVDNNALGEYAMGQLNCDVSDISCAREASADDVLSATFAAYSDIPQTNPSINAGTPWRAMKGAYVTGSIEKGVKSSIPMIMTTVANEAGSATADYFDPSYTNTTELTYTNSDGETTSMSDALSLVFNAGRGPVLANMTQVYPEALVEDGLREQFEVISTDGLWRCPTQYNAVQ